MYGFAGCGGKPSGDGTCISNTVVGTYNTNEIAQDVSVDGDMAVVPQGSAGIAVFDITQRDRPVLLSTLYQFAEVYSARVYDNHIYAYLKKNADAKYYLRIIDISDLEFPAMTAEINFDEIKTNISAIKSNWIAFDGDYIHVLGRINGVSGNYHILDLSDRTNPLIESSMDINGFCGTISAVNELVIRDDLAYIGSYKGLDIIDFSDRSNPVSVSQTLSGCYYKSFDMNGDILYSSGGSSLSTFDIADPNSPTLLHSITTPTKYILVSEVNGTAYTLGLNGEISILDVSDPSALKDTDDDIYVGSLSYRTVDDKGYLYVADNEGLKIIDTCIR